MSKQKRKSSVKRQSGGLSSTTMWIGIAAVLVLIVTGAVFILTRPSLGAPAAQLSSVIDVHAAAQMRDEGAFILDVREPEEWVEYHIPGTTLIPLGQLESRLSELPKDQEIVVVCRSGNRSQTGRDILKGAGFDQVTSMDGGLLGWQAAGYEWVTGE